MNCEYCSQETNRLITSKKINKKVCRKCYQRLNRDVTISEPSKYGEISYDINNNPICHICGEGHKKLMSHVHQVHKISAYDYKKKFGVDTTLGIMNENSKEIARLNNAKHKDTVVANNLLVNGDKTRFKNGSKGRPKDMLSEMSRRRLVNNLHGGDNNE